MFLIAPLTFDNRMFVGHGRGLGLQKVLHLLVLKKMFLMTSSNRAATFLTVANPVFLGIRELCHSNEWQIVENNEEREALEIGLTVNLCTWN
jgi:hypothetical protein